MKTKNQIKIENLTKKIGESEDLLKDMISNVDEWKDSRDMRNILLGQIRKEQFNLKVMNLRLKFMKFIESFRNKTTTKTRKA